MKQKRDYNYIDCHVLCIAITVAIFIIAVLEYPTAWPRLLEAGKDFGLSIAFWFCFVFKIPNVIVPSVTDPSQTLSHALVSLPTTWSGFKDQFVAYWRLFVYRGNFVSYWQSVGSVVGKIAKVLMICLPFLVLLIIVIKQLSGGTNNKYNKDTIPMRLWRMGTTAVYVPSKWGVQRFGAFVRDHKIYWVSWLLLGLYAYNGISIALATFAYLFYFAVSLDIGSIPVQLGKLAVDLYPVCRDMPWPVWLVVAAVLIDRWRRSMGYARLDHMERRNKGFINERPIVYMLCGTMGSRKTTAITDMALSSAVEFRRKALERLLANSLKFPNFPWINLENAIKNTMAKHLVYNLATAREFIERQHIRWTHRPCAKRLFGYDANRYGATYDDALKVQSIWEVIKTYAQLYLIYIMESSLILSNYSIRSDATLQSIGNFPLWNCDFFRRDSATAELYSKRSHIIDFDAMRLGLKMIEDNPNADFLEFGVINLTEIGKERGNMLENEGKKKTDEKANPKNDGFNRWLKVCRHAATVDNICFLTVLFDEQRAESLGLDARDLADILYIKGCSDQKLAMPLFTLGELITTAVLGRFNNTYADYRYRRGDNTLLMHWYKGVAAAVSRHYVRIQNTFGYRVLDVEITNAKGDVCKSGKYFLSSKKIYSDRFSTDCFNSFFDVKALRSKVGLADQPTYAGRTATFEELDLQNSYFFGDLKKGFGMEDKDNKDNKGDMAA